MPMFVWRRADSTVNSIQDHVSHTREAYKGARLRRKKETNKRGAPPLSSPCRVCTASFDYPEKWSAPSSAGPQSAAGTSSHPPTLSSSGGHMKQEENRCTELLADHIFPN